MKMSFRFPFLIAISIVLLLRVQTTFTLNPLSTFGNGASGTNVPGSIQPAESLGISPLTGFTVYVTAQNTPSAWYVGETNQDTRASGSTNGFNMRGITYDPTSGNLI